MTLDEFKELWYDDSDFIIANTSGSTGKPKEIRLCKADMIASARATNEFFGIVSESTLFLPLSLDYIAGKMMAVRAFVANCRLVVVEPANHFQLQYTDKIDLMAVVPSQVDCLIENPQRAKKIRNVIIGGAPLSEDRKNLLLEVGYNAYVTYGMTETCSHVAIKKLGKEDAPFYAMPGIGFDLDDRGCLVIKAPAFSFKRLVTNDVACLVGDKAFFWKGRFDNVINSGGIKIFPEELEKDLSKFINRDFFIRGVKDDKWGEAVEMVIEGSDPLSPYAWEAIKNSINHKYIPKSIIYVDSLPRTANGKINRSQI